MTNDHSWWVYLGPCPSHWSKGIFFSSSLSVTLCNCSPHPARFIPRCFWNPSPVLQTSQIPLLSGAHQRLDTTMTSSYTRSSRSWNRIHTEDQILNIQATLGKEFPTDCHTHARRVSLTSVIRSWQSPDLTLSVLMQTGAPSGQRSSTLHNPNCAKMPSRIRV